MQEHTYTIEDGQYLNALKHRLRAITTEVMALTQVYPDNQESHEIKHEMNVLFSAMAQHNLTPNILTNENRCITCGNLYCSECDMCHNRDVKGQRCSEFIAPGTDCPEYSVDQEDADNEWSAATH